MPNDSPDLVKSRSFGDFHAPLKAHFSSALQKVVWSKNWLQGYKQWKHRSFVNIVCGVFQLVLLISAFRSFCGLGPSAYFESMRDGHDLVCNHHTRLGNQFYHCGSHLCANFCFIIGLVASSLALTGPVTLVSLFCLFGLGWRQSPPFAMDVLSLWRNNFPWHFDDLLMFLSRITHILVLSCIGRWWHNFLWMPVLLHEIGFQNIPSLEFVFSFSHFMLFPPLTFEQFLAFGDCIALLANIVFWIRHCIAPTCLTIYTSFCPFHCRCHVKSGWKKCHKDRHVRTSSVVPVQRRTSFSTTVALILVGLLHSGEAANPGPQDRNRFWTLGTFNPTGFNGKQQIISDHLGYGDIWSVAETHLSSGSMQAFKKGLRNVDSPFKFCIGGHPAPLRPHSEHTGSWTGVAVLSKHPTRAVSGPFSEDIFSSSRIQMTATLCHDMWVTGVTLYGEPPGQGHPSAAAHTELLVGAAVDAISNVRGFRFVSGDFNFTPEQLEGIEKLHQLGFRDLQDIAAERWGISPSHTCKGTSRKDFMFNSQELQGMLDSVIIEHDIWADHSVLAGRFSASLHDCVTPIWRMPQPLEWPADFRDSPSFLEVSFCHQDPTEAYGLMWSQTEAYACHRLSTLNSVPSRSQLGRGQTKSTVDRKGPVNPMHLKPSRKGDVVPDFVGSSKQHSMWFRQLRRLQAYMRFRHRNPNDTQELHGAALWRSILVAKGFHPSFVQWWNSACLDGAPAECPLVPPSYLVAEGMFHSFSHAVRSLEGKLKYARQQVARKHRVDQTNVIFRDIKKASPERVDMFVSALSATVVGTEEYDASIAFEPAVQFDFSFPVFINGKEFSLLNSEPALIHVDDASGISPGDKIAQTCTTGKLPDMFALFGREWSRRWDRHQHVLPSQWEQILAFSQSHLPSKAARYVPISLQQVVTEIKRKKSTSSSGPDGISVHDLRSMPDCVLQAHCDLYSRAERDGAWPVQTLVGRVASLAKNAHPSQVKDFRPITVLSHCYRLWGGLRSKELLRHVDELCPSFLFGNRPGCHAMQLWMYVQWMIETAHVSGQPLAGIQADIQKAFNHIPREVVLQACVILGMPSQILAAWAGALGSIQRRFQIRDATGPPLWSSTGCPEGCSMSCLGMLVIDILFHRRIEAQCVIAQPLSYVDDWQILTKSPADIPILLDALERFTAAVDLQLDPAKTFVWSPNAAARKSFREGHFSYCNQAKSLGAQMQYTRRHAAKVIIARIEEVQDLWPRLRLSPSPYKLKIRAVRVAAWPKAFHGVAATTIGPDNIQRARAGAMKGINANGSGCSSIVQLGLIECPNTDPLFWIILQTFRSVRDSHSQQAVEPLIQLALDHCVGLPRGGPTNALIGRIHKLGWQILSGMELVDVWGSFSFFHASYPEIVIRAERAWLNIVAETVSDRDCFSGLHQADPLDTRKFLGSLTVPDQAIFRKSLNGAHFTNDFCYHFSDSGSLLCDYCGQHDSRLHRFWKCPCFEEHRASCPSDIRRIVDDLPLCLTTAGWSLRSCTTDGWMKMLNEIQIPDAQPAEVIGRQAGTAVDLFTDGSCFWPDRIAYRVASWAVTYAAPEFDLTHSHVIHTGPLPGILQSAFRAEIFGVLQALKWCRLNNFLPRIWTDCLGVVRRCRKLLLDPQKLPPNIPHGDLWKQVQEEVLCIGPNRIVISKVAAHQSIEDAQSSIEQWGFLHNSLADRAARLSNLLRDDSFWAFHSKHAREVELMKHISRSVQQVILDVSRAVVGRENAFQEEPNETAQGEATSVRRQSKPGQWTAPQFSHVLPASLTEKFGFRAVATMVGWLQQALQQGATEHAEVGWVSLCQLYLDFQMSTGEAGPICLKQWIDPVARPSILLQKFPFKRRCAWFARMLKLVLKSSGGVFSHSTTRSKSVILQLHLPCIWIPWPTCRLEWVEQWIGQHLDQAATRSGKCLNGLPFAKQDGRWPTFDILQRPLRL